MTTTRTHPATLTDADLARFERDGWVRVPGAFSADEAAAMREVIWAELATRGMRRHDPATWHDESPAHLQHLKADPAFAAVGSARTRGAIADLLGSERAAPSDWGAFFLLFPTPRPWFVPHKAWHIDHDWTDPAAPVQGLKVHALFGEVEPRAGGMTIVAGSHRIVEHLVRDIGPADGTPAAKIRHAVMRGHPYLRALETDHGADPERRAERIARFVDAEGDVLGFPARVVELTGQPGDLLLIHPLVLHTRPTNAGAQPRFLLNKDLYPSPGA